MAQHKSNRVTRSQAKQTTDTKTGSKKQKQTQQKTPSKIQGQKRKIQQQNSLLKMGFNKPQKQKIEQNKIHLISLKQLLKTITIKQLMEKCPKVKDFYKKICTHPQNDEQLLLQCLDKYFHSNVSAMWEHKYAPRNMQQILQKNFAKKIQEWIKDFYLYRKNSDQNDSEFSFIDDRFNEQYSKSIQMRMQSYGWDCLGMILKGRNGIGKISTLNAVAKSMKFSVFQFSAESDQLLKLKQQIKGSSESECVNTIINKKKQQQNNKIRRQNKSIFNFMNNNQREQDHYIESKKPKRLQIFRDFTQYYPNDDKTERYGADQAYLSYLLNAVHNSNIPYVLTTSKQQQNYKDSIIDKLSKLDQIQFEQASIEQISKLLWIILQIQINFEFNPNKQIQPQNIYEQLNRQLNQFNFEYDSYMCTYTFIRQLVLKANKKLRYIYKYLQYVIKQQILKTRSEVSKQSNPVIQNYKIDQQKNQNQVLQEVIFSQKQDKIQQNSDNNHNINSITHKKDPFLQFIKNTKKQPLLSQNQKSVADSITDQIQLQILSNLDSHRLIYDLDWSIIQHKAIQTSHLQQTADIQYSEKSFQEVQNLNKYIIGKQFVEQQAKKCKDIPETGKTLRQIRRQLELAVIKDRPSIKNHKIIISTQIQQLQPSYEQLHPYQCIPYHIHKDSKIKLIKSMNKKRVENNKYPFYMNIKTFYMLPILLAPKRSNRSLRKINSQRLEQNLNKVFTGQQIEYIKKYCKFVYPL